MDDLHVISERKYHIMTGAAIIMPIITVVLLVPFVYFVLCLIALNTSYLPDDGRWYCDELGIELCFDPNSEQSDIININGEDYLISMVAHHNLIKINEIKNVIPIDVENHGARVWVENGDYIYEYGDLMYRLTAFKLKKDYFKVRDQDGNEYVFIRKEG